MIKAVTTAALALALTTTLAVAQSSQPQGGADQSPAATSQMNKSSDNATMSSDKMGKAANAQNAMKKKKKMKKAPKTDATAPAPADATKK